MSQYLRSRYQALDAYVPGEQPKDQQYIKLNTNESPYPPAPEVVQALDDEQIRQLRLYSDPVGKTLKEKLAKLYDVGPENIFISNGSDDILNFAFMAFSEDGAVFPDISYGFYPVFAQLHGVDFQEIPLRDDFSIDYRDYCQAGKLVVIANPNAPTGMLLPVSQIEQIVRSNEDHVVVIDEAYIDFGGESCYRLLDRYDNLIVVRTYSKSRSMAGARLGYAIGSAQLIADLEKIKYSTNPYNVNRLTMRLGEVTVDAEVYYQDKCAKIVQTRGFTTNELRGLGFEVLPSSANFIFARLPAFDGKTLYEALKKQGILVRHFNKPRIQAFIRITIGTPEQMQTFIACIKTIISGGSYEDQQYQP